MQTRKSWRNSFERDKGCCSRMLESIPNKPLPIIMSR